MFARLARSSIAFGLVFIAYQAYTLAVAPLVDPPVVGRAARSGGGAVVTVSPVEKYQRELASYFPPDHWLMQGKPKVIESGQVVLIVDDYLRDNTGRVDLTKCVVVLFPTPLRSGQAPPRDAVIIEAPGGAKLQFDEEFNPSRGKIGNLVQGLLPGRITVRSDMHEPGPQDDLRVETSNLQMNDSRIITQDAVTFRLGKNHGSGRLMEISLVQEEFKRPGSAGFGFRGVQHLELFKDVSFELHVGSLNLAEDKVADAARPRPGHVLLTAATGADAWVGAADARSVYAPLTPPPRAAATPRNRAGAEPPAPPLVVGCGGSFYLSFLDFTATFNEKVVATQLSLTGQSDQLTCEQLAIHFTDSQGAISPQNEPDFAERQRNALEGLTPTLLEATGDPVIMDSPSRDAQARARRLALNLATRELRLDGGSPILQHGASELRAPVIRYQHPAQEDRAPIGRLWLAGPGQMRIVPNEERPQEVVEAHWNAAPGMEFPVQLTRDGGKPVLVVEGRPRVISSRLGRITSDRLRIAMREVPADGDGPAIEVRGGDGTQAILVDRIRAIGQVSMQSPELDGAVNELELRVRAQEQSLELAAPGVGAPRGAAIRGESNAKKRYRLTAEKMRMDLLMQDRRATPADLICEGGVVFSEDAPAAPGQAPMSVSGERLRANHLQSGSVVVSVDGAGDAAAAQALAQIQAQGMTLRSATVNLDQAANRLWADGAGDARVLVNRDLTGDSASGKTELNLKWQGGLDFDGKTIVVKQEVLGVAPHDWVRCQEVRATLTRAISFADSRGSVAAVQVETIDCLGGVTMDHRGVDEAGQTSHEHGKLQTLTINQTTGEISGTGPGWVRSVRLESASNPLTAAAGREQPNTGGKGLRFLRVEFLRNLSGNLLAGRRQVAFHGNVQAVYGPVLGWEQELLMNFPTGLPPDTGTLQCEDLAVSEDPLTGLARGVGAGAGGLGPIELKATGSVQIQAAAKGKAILTAYAHAATYSKAKETFTLEGNSQAPARLYRQESPGAKPSFSNAQMLEHHLDTGSTTINGHSQSSFGPPSAAQLPAAPPR